MYKTMASAVTLLILQLSSPAWSQSPDRFQGQYSQPTMVISGEHGADPELAMNSIDISKVADLSDTYFVDISTVGGNIHTCEFSVEMKYVGNQLTFGSNENECSVRVSRTDSGIAISANNCEDYCGAGADLEGTGKGFTKDDDGDSITRSQEEN